MYMWVLLWLKPVFMCECEVPSNEVGKRMQVDHPHNVTYWKCNAGLLLVRLY